MLLCQNGQFDRVAKPGVETSIGIRWMIPRLQPGAFGTEHLISLSIEQLRARLRDPILALVILP
jgi:hypothetical protein